MRCCLLAVLLATLLAQPATPISKSEVVRSWAKLLGDDLWRLSQTLTKSEQIRMKYKQMNASVQKKDGKQILDSSLRSVSTMLTRKINAVKCIHATAKKLAKEFVYNETRDSEFKYCSAKYSPFIYEPGQEIETPQGVTERPQFAEKSTHYLEIGLERDSHFYNISVNTSTSCVHVPTNIYYLEDNAKIAILWTEQLNDVFVQNYLSDPSLSWQYFGTAHGVMRFYPAMPWNKMKVDTYDCRVQTWYIEAATCSKDVIILFDVSGSMTGFKNYIARRTLKSLLSTLSNNDYVNVFTFKKTTDEAVECFKDLVQATPENKKTIENVLEPKENKDGTKHHKVELEGNANLTEAYIKAFTTLKKKRATCNLTSTQGCNQLVMVITDYVPGNLTEVFEEYNREVIDNKTYIPVRVFTYLIGKEVTNVREIQSMACTNRGYFVHIHSVEEVQQQVLKYINVIARPMILAGKEPPPTWTHANIDETRTINWKVSGDENKPDEDKLVTSVAIPAFDSDESNENATLLGVAGTDVPIDSIAKLAQPHQLGVNGYPLIVSNNGFLLLHPLLVATINDNLQDNFNSVDFVEVEQVDDGKGPRELGEKIQKLRWNLVHGIDGNMTDVEVLFHYDNMRRIARVKHDYFFNKLEGTPFSMGISLPKGYGDTELMLRDNPLEAKEGKDLTGVNVTDYFKSNFRVHPDWVYCKYHYLEGHEAENAEVEIFRFLVLISRNELNITYQQYMEKEKDNFTVETHCGTARKRLGTDEYYCTEDLVKQLVFDAKLTDPYYKAWVATESDKALARKYNVSVRFIATSSGLTRWDYIFDPYKNERVNDDGTRKKEYPGKVFGDIYHNAIEETWYKAAVLQHMISKESLVIATKLPILDPTIQNRPPVQNEDGDITVTASYAIFYKDGASETPASVVGFQYSYLKFYESFIEIMNKKSKREDKHYSALDQFTCGEKYHCYLVDSSGYVVLSAAPENKSEVGMFFGVINVNAQLVMQQLLDRNVFQHVEVFNYQALCPSSILEKIQITSSCSTFMTPFALAGNFMRWLFSELMLLILNWNQYVYADTDYIIDDLEPTTTPKPDEFNETIRPEEKEETFSCDHSITLYILNQTTEAREEMGLPRLIYEDTGGECHPAFWAAYVPKTNLLLVVVDQDFDNETEYCPKPRSTVPEPTGNSSNSTEPCHKLDLGSLERRRLEGCFTYHDKEKNISQCGGGSATRGDLTLFLSAALLTGLASRLLSS